MDRTIRQLWSGTKYKSYVFFYERKLTFYTPQAFKIPCLNGSVALLFIDVPLEVAVP